MSRARNIKPGFFKNDLLAECSPLARILFCGLWCEADREGRLEDRPKRIKADCLPYDDCDCNALLDELASRGFIVRYESGKALYIAIPEFVKHQNPHCKEAPSTIPAPCEHSASPVQAEEIPARATLIPSSLIPDSLQKQKQPQAALTTALPEWVNRDAWDGFAAMRKRQRHPMTDRAAKLVLGELGKLRDEGHDPGAVLDQSTRNGWRDVYPIKSAGPVRGVVRSIGGESLDDQLARAI